MFLSTNEYDLQARGVNSTQVNQPPIETFGASCCSRPVFESSNVMYCIGRGMEKRSLAFNVEHRILGFDFIPKGFKTVAGGKSRSHRDATTGCDIRNGFTILKGLQIRAHPAMRSAIPSALDRIVRACNPVVRYRDHRLMSVAPFGACGGRARTTAITDVAARKLTIRKRPIRDFGASLCYAGFCSNCVGLKSHSQAVLVASCAGE